MRHHYLGSWGRVTLSPLERQDIEPLRAARNRARDWFVYSQEISESAQAAWFEKYLQTSGDYMFRIALTQTPQAFIGAVALYNIDTGAGDAEYGRIVIDHERAGQRGLGLDATVCVCKIGFEQLSLDAIHLQVYSNNIAARRTYEKAGFRLTREADGMAYMRLEGASLLQNI